MDSNNILQSVIAHSFKSSKTYVGSPSLVVIDEQTIIVSHDFFGPNSEEFEEATTHIYISRNKGESWEKISEIRGAFWSKLFLFRDELYLLGTNKHHGNIVLRKSHDLGHTWTFPNSNESGLLFEGEYHTAPTPVVEFEGRLYKAFERKNYLYAQWPQWYEPVVLSVSIHEDILQSYNWKISNTLSIDNSYLNSNFVGWLEGNIVVKDNRLHNTMRVESIDSKEEYIANILIDHNEYSISFDDDFYTMPGGSKKFTIYFDEVTKKYFSLVNRVENIEHNSTNTAYLRNRLSLISSDDLKSWNLVKDILFADDEKYCGFQYVDWQFMNNDIYFVCRTAYYDEEGHAHTYHDSNYITFHRIENFRE